MATTAALIVHNLVNHLGLEAGKTGIALMHRAFLKTGAIIAGASALLLLLQLGFAPGLPVAVGLVALTTLMVVRVTRRELAADATFPELLRVPGLRQLLT